MSETTGTFESAPPGDDLGRARNARLWREWRRRGDASARGRLIESLVPLVDALCRRRQRAGVPAFLDVDDMTSAAYVAMIGAVEKYDPQRGGSIESFVWTRCEGAILDWMRQQIPGSRGLRDYERRRRVLASRLNRKPTERELAEALGQSAEQVRRREIARETRVPVSLQESAPVDSGGTELADTLVARDRREDPEASLELGDTTRLVRAALGRLPERERLAVVAPVLEGTTLHTVGEELGVSASRVSQLRARAIAQLRDELEAHGDLAAA